MRGAAAVRCWSLERSVFLLVAGMVLAAPATSVPVAVASVAAAPADQEASSTGAAAGESSQPAAAATPWFVQVTEKAGVAKAHRNRSFENPYAHIMEGYTALGASVAVADYDGDGHLDLFVTDSSRHGRNLLYRNRGDVSFEEVGEKAGVAAGNDAQNASANSLWFDRDNDGDSDLLVVRFGQNQLFDNLGDGTFREITRGSGLERYLNCITAIAFDYDLDGDLDLFYANYFAPVNLFDPETSRFFPESFETAANGGGVTVFRNDLTTRTGDGAKLDGKPKGPLFTDVTKQVGLGAISGWSLDLGHADADHDGDDDLYVAADFGTDSFFRNNGDGTFTDLTKVAIGIDTKKGMNVDWGDFDGDGLFDLYVTNITDEYMKEGNFLWHNQGELRFTDVARETGSHDTGWGWAGKFLDFDNDGWLDLYVVNGWVSGNEENYVLDIFELIINEEIDLADASNWPAMGEKTLSGYQRSSLFHNQGGALFEDVAARHGMDSILDGRGVAVADFDHDGRLDLFVSNANEKPILALGRGEAGHWLALSFEGRASNRDGVGTRVRVRAGGRDQWSFVNGGNGFASQSSQVVHFGLGDATKIEQVEVWWPSGERQQLGALAIDKRHHLVEGSRPRLWQPGPRVTVPAKAPAEKVKP